jgi:hypothetical protein
MLRTMLLRNVVRNRGTKHVTRRQEARSADHRPPTNICDIVTYVASQQEARSMLRTTLLRNVVRNRRHEVPTADRRPPITSQSMFFIT